MKKSETLYQSDRDAGTFVSASNGNMYEDFLLQNDFQRKPQCRALRGCEVTLPKADDELPGDDWFANDPIFCYGSERQAYVRERAQKDTAARAPLEVSAPQQASKSSSASTPVHPQVPESVAAFLPLPNKSLIKSASIPAPPLASVQSSAAGKQSDWSQVPALTVAMPTDSQTVPIISASMLQPILHWTAFTSFAGFSETWADYGDEQNAAAEADRIRSQLPTPSFSSSANSLNVSAPALETKAAIGFAPASTSSKPRGWTPASPAPVMHCTVLKTAAVPSAPTRRRGRQSLTRAKTQFSGRANDSDSPSRSTRSQ